MNVEVQYDDSKSKDDCTEMCNKTADTEPLQKEGNAESEVEPKDSRRLITQILLTAIVTIVTASAGMPIGYSAILLPQLKSMNGSLQVDDEMGSWIVSVHSAASPIGALLSGTLMDYFGRKMTLQLCCIPLIAGWIVIMSSHNHALILVGRILAGTAVGVVAAPCQVYIAEMSDPNLRGMFSSIPFASYSFGILLVYMLGTAANWRMVAGICMVLPAMSMILFCCLPESPAWLVKKGRIEKATRSYHWVNGGSTAKVKREIQQLVTRVENEGAQSKATQRSLWRTFLSSNVLKPFVIVNIFGLFQSLTGVYVIVFYAVMIISTMQNSGLNEFHAATLTAAVRFIAAIAASVLLAFTGRRAIALLSTIGTALSALCLSIFLQTDYSNTYLILSLLIFYVAANTIGLMILPGVLVGELFPLKVRGIAGSLSFTIINLTMFSFAKIFPFMKSLIGIGNCFLFFGVTSIAGSIFLYATLPETKNQTLNDIEDYFMQENLLWITRNRRRRNGASKTQTSKV
uniref:Major facilitator superfamily (MFS) profile domain-containing protein n=2 Tax=Photinus pyralis TaxID=7054 RepID=A0A1Y1L0W9_PHOPY